MKSTTPCNFALTTTPTSHLPIKYSQPPSIAISRWIAISRPRLRPSCVSLLAFLPLTSDLASELRALASPPMLTVPTFVYRSRGRDHCTDPAGVPTTRPPLRRAHHQQGLYRSGSPQQHGHAAGNPGSGSSVPFPLISRAIHPRLTLPLDQGCREPAGPYPTHSRALGGWAHTQAGRGRERARRDHRSRGREHDRHTQPATVQDAPGLRYFGRRLRTVRGWLADTAPCGGCSDHGHRPSPSPSPSQCDSITNERTSLACRDVLGRWNRITPLAVKR